VHSKQLTHHGEKQVEQTILNPEKASRNNNELFEGNESQKCRGVNSQH